MTASSRDRASNRWERHHRNPPRLSASCETRVAPGREGKLTVWKASACSTCREPRPVFPPREPVRTCSPVTRRNVSTLHAALHDGRATCAAHQRVEGVWVLGVERSPEVAGQVPG